MHITNTTVVGFDGLKGLQGDTGSNGLLGLSGDPGLSGTPGIAGNLGTKGERGERGPPGLPGLSSSKYIVDSTISYNISIDFYIVSKNLNERGTIQLIRGLDCLQEDEVTLYIVLSAILLTYYDCT